MLLEDGPMITFRVNGGRDAGFAARRALVAGDGALPTKVREDVLLLLTELVTNAVRHADVGPKQSLSVELSQWPRRVRLAVVDPGAGFTPVRTRRGPGEPGGLGLFLVDRIAARWGVQPAAAGNRVWFELEFER
jgi:anti-sigma regulatory factor (Ser/Thr protein kinase)